MNMKGRRAGVKRKMRKKCSHFSSEKEKGKERVRWIIRDDCEKCFKENVCLLAGPCDERFFWNFSATSHCLSLFVSFYC